MPRFVARAFVHASLALGSAFFLAGCAAIGMGPAANPDASMDQVRLERLFERQVEKVAGGTGYIRSRVDGVDLVLISDPTTDRMQLIVQVPFAETVGVQHLVGMLQANFHHGLDAKYAVSEGGFFSVFGHRLSTLTEEDFVAGYHQALTLAQQFESVTSGVEVLEEAPPDAGAR